MKRLITVLCLVIAMTTLLTACGKFTCDECEKETKGEKYEVNPFGEEMTVCEECKEKFEQQIHKQTM